MGTTQRQTACTVVVEKYHLKRNHPDQVTPDDMEWADSHTRGCVSCKQARAMILGPLPPSQPTSPANLTAVTTGG